MVAIQKLDLKKIFKKGFSRGKSVQVNIITIDMHDKNKEYCAAVIVKMAKKSKELVD